MTAPQQQPPPPPYPAPGYAPPPPAPPRKRHIGRWVLMGLGALVVVIIGASLGSHPTPPAGPTAPAPADQSAPPPATQAPAGHHVVYKVTAASSAAASITYNSDGSASIQQETDAKLPWTKEIDLDADQAFSIVQVTAQNGGGGKITCEIDVDGKPVKTGTASGQYAIASCDATVK